MLKSRKLSGFSCWFDPDYSRQGAQMGILDAFWNSEGLMCLRNTEEFLLFPPTMLLPASKKRVYMAGRNIWRRSFGCQLQTDGYEADWRYTVMTDGNLTLVGGDSANNTREVNNRDIWVQFTFLKESSSAERKWSWNFWKREVNTWDFWIYILDGGWTTHQIITSGWVCEDRLRGQGRKLLLYASEQQYSPTACRVFTTVFWNPQMKKK